MNESLFNKIDDKFLEVIQMIGFDVAMSISNEDDKEFDIDFFEKEFRTGFDEMMSLARTRFNSLCDSAIDPIMDGVKKANAQRLENLTKDPA